MNFAEVSASDTDELVTAYRAAAKAHGDEEADVLASHQSAHLLAAIYAELRQRGIEHQSQLLPLLSDINASVRLWSASHALEFDSPRGEAVLERLASAKGAIGLTAEITLE